MAETSIEWARWTFNPWRGCTKVSPGCDHCYAETLSKRNPKVLGVWGDDGTRVIAAESYWRAPLTWNAEAAAAVVRERVFCASLADWLEDRRDLDAARYRLFDLIELTPALDWLLLTKRIENFDKLARGSWVVSGCPANVWLGVTAEDQQRADERIPILLRTAARVRFISAEPLLGPLALRDYFPDPLDGAVHIHGMDLPPVDWVIVGGESGHDARPMHPSWPASLCWQCRDAGVPFFFKQWGEWQEGSKLPDFSGEIVLADGRHARYPEDFGRIDVMTWGRLLPQMMAKVGKKAAGRTLDGRTWDELPR